MVSGVGLDIYSSAAETWLRSVMTWWDCLQDNIFPTAANKYWFCIRCSALSLVGLHPLRYVTLTWPLIWPWLWAARRCVRAPTVSLCLYLISPGHWALGRAQLIEAVRLYVLPLLISWLHWRLIAALSLVPALHFSLGSPHSASHQFLVVAFQTSVCLPMHCVIVRRSLAVWVRM